MSDGYGEFGHEPNGGYGEGGCGGSSAYEGVRDVGGAATVRLQLHCVLEALPQLGSVLWLHRGDRDRIFPRARLTTRGVALFEHPALAGLADCVAVDACSAVAAHGPREWLEFSGPEGTAIAKLYLLPDTDYLAWDLMLAGCSVTTVPARPRRGWQAHAAVLRSAFVRRGAPWQARLARLPLLRLIGLNVLGLRAPEPVSALGCRIARMLAEEERAIWQDA